MYLENFENYIIDFFKDDIYSADEKNQFNTLIEKFQDDYSISQLKNLTINDYIYGINTNDDGFYYRITKDTEIVGRLNWYHNTSGVYLSDEKIIINPHHSKYGKTVDEVFSSYKKALIEIYNAAMKADIEKLKNIEFPDTVKYKLASMYNPQKFLTVYSDRHLQYFLGEMTGDKSISDGKDYFKLMKLLLEEKENYHLTKGITNHKYSRLLYYLFGKVDRDWNIQMKGVVSKDKGEKKLSNYDEDLELTVIETTLINAEKKAFKYNPDKKDFIADYEKKQRSSKRNGNFAEDKVFKYEVKKLKNGNRPDLANKVEHVSKKSDSRGYDILSFDLEGNKKYIEVKSTVSGSDSFFLSINEMLFAEESEEKDNYWIYFVKKKNGKYEVIEIHNPFLPENRKLLSIQPTNFKVDMRFE